MRMQLLVCMHSSQVCASAYAKEDLSSRTFIFLCPTAANLSKVSANFHVCKGKETTEIQMATCGMLQSYQALLLDRKYRREDRSKEDDKWKVANSGAGKENEKKVGRSW